MKHSRAFAFLTMIMLSGALFSFAPNTTLAIYQRQTDYGPASYFGYIDEEANLSISNNVGEARLKSRTVPLGSFMHSMDLMGDGWTEFDYYFYATFGSDGFVDLPSFTLDGAAVEAIPQIMGNDPHDFHADHFDTDSRKELLRQYLSNYDFLCSDTAIKHYRYYVTLRSTDAYFNINVSASALFTDSPDFTVGANGEYSFNSYQSYQRRLDGRYDISFYAIAPKVTLSYEENVTIEKLAEEDTTVRAAIANLALGHSMDVSLARSFFAAKYNKRYISSYHLFWDYNNKDHSVLCRCRFNMELSNTPKKFVAKREGKARYEHQLDTHVAGTHYPCPRISLRGWDDDTKVLLYLETPGENDYYDGFNTPEKDESGAYVVKGNFAWIEVCPNLSGNVPIDNVVSGVDNTLPMILTLLVPPIYPAVAIVCAQRGSMVGLIGSTIIFFLAFVGVFCGIFIPKIVRRARAKKKK